MNKNYQLIIPIFIGIVLGIFATYLFTSFTVKNDTQANNKKPLYWVAPMDSNYQRSKPGKSPMGMDLVPVYAEDTNNSRAGEIKIAANVVNNLGVRTAIVNRRILQPNINTVGYVQYDEEKLIHIHPRVSGWIEKLYITAEGDPIVKKQPLYDIYSPELVNAQEELLLALQRNNNTFIRAAEERLRALQLPQSFIKKFRQDKIVKQTVTFYSPQNGVIGNLNIREGFYVKPGNTLMSIGDLSSVWVEAEVFERQAAWVKNNDKVTMTLGYLPGKTWHGKVDYIYPSLDAKTRTVKLRLRFSNQDSLLKPNMFVQLTIHSGISEKVLSVPREAIIRTGQQDRVVLALDDGYFKSVAVVLGRSDVTNTEIIQGVKEGDKVVTSAQFLIDSESSKTSDFKRMEKTQSDNTK